MTPIAHAGTGSTMLKPKPNDIQVNGALTVNITESTVER